MNIYSPGEDIVKCGEQIRGALLVSRGEVELLKGSITERKMKRLDRFAQECLFIDKVSMYDVRSKGFSEVILIPRALMIVVCHWCGCLWYIVASLSISLGYSQNWRDADKNNEQFTISHSDFGGFAAYFRSMYWAIVGMSTVGYGDIIPTNIIEINFATVVILFGA